jgi:hypothetical protein
MTEELKIYIKAITDEAKKKIKGIREEIKKTEKNSREAKAKIKDFLGSVAKGAAAAVGAIVALTAAMVTLGKSTEEFRKAQAKVNTTFQAMGSNATAADNTFRSLYRVLGDNATAAETAQSLALITTNEKELAEWTQILQGVYSSMGDKLPINSLAEAANETIRVGKVTGVMADSLSWLGISEDAFNEQLAATVSYEEREALVRNTLNNLYSNSAKLYEKNNAATLAYNDSQYSLNKAMADAANYTIPLMTAVNNLGAVFFNTFAPAIRTACVYLAAFIDWVSSAVAWVGSLFGLLSGNTNSVSAIGTALADASASVSGASAGINKVGSAFGNAAEEAKELKKQAMGFDELNVVSSAGASGAASSGTGSNTGGGVPIVSGLGSAAPDLSGFSKSVEEAKGKIEAVLTLVGLVAVGLLAWKIHSLGDAAKMAGFFKSIAGYAMIIAGGILLVNGYTDAWVNGIDWVNFGEIMAGIGLIVGGVALVFGSFAGALATAIGGIAMIVIGVKDFIENGYSMESVLMIVIGVMTTLIGIVWAFNSALLANPIFWVIEAIIALVAVFVILWNECEGFRNFWITIWGAIKTAFSAVWEFLKEGAAAVAGFFIGAWESIRTVWNGVGSFFSGVWAGIQKAFSSVTSWFTKVFKTAWEGVKRVFSTGGKIFSGITEGIADIFKTVVNGIISGINVIIAAPFKTINGFLNMIRNISFMGISPFKKLWGQDPLPVPQIPMLAKGGIVDSATLAMIGERGREIVLPLENNTGWMDTLAERLANKKGTPSHIVLMLDGKVLGWASINNINDITRQTGSIPLVLA